MKVKIPNYKLWKWSEQARSGVAGDVIASIQSIGSGQNKFTDKGETRYALMRNELMLLPAFEAVEKMRVKFLHEAIEAQSKAGVKADRLSGEFLTQYGENFNTLMSTEEDYEIRQLKWSQLNVGGNNIGTEVLKPLMGSVVIDDFTAVE